jgi:hypothetical protein
VDRDVYLYHVCETRIRQEFCPRFDSILCVFYRFSELATAFQEEKVARYCLLSLSLSPVPKNGEHE